MHRSDKERKQKIDEETRENVGGGESEEEKTNKKML